MKKINGLEVYTIDGQVNYKDGFYNDIIIQEAEIGSDISIMKEKSLVEMIKLLFHKQDFMRNIELSCYSNEVTTKTLETDYDSVSITRYIKKHELHITYEFRTSILSLLERELFFINFVGREDIAKKGIYLYSFNVGFHEDLLKLVKKEIEYLKKDYV